MEKYPRRKFLERVTKIGFGFAVSTIPGSSLLAPEPNPGNSPKKEVEITKESPRLVVNNYMDYQKLKPEVPLYTEIHKEVDPSLFKLPGEETRHGATTEEGKMIRTLRFQNIADAVEDRYDLPKGILLALIFNESTGVEYLGNASGDGGYGLIHTQANVARMYGLKVFKDCKSLVCNSERGCKDSLGRYQNHAEGLKNYIQEHKRENRFDRKALADEDERLNHLLNIDMIGRMFALSMSGPRIKTMGQELDPFESAIYQFHVGFPKKFSVKDSPEERLEKENKNKKSFDKYKNYMSRFKKVMKELNDPKILDELKDVFENLNKDIMIDGQEATFKKYIELMSKQNENFGLEVYKTLPKYKLSVASV